MLPGDSAVQQQAQPVVTEIAEAVPDAQDFLDQQVDRFGGAVADSAGAEVGQELIAPGGEGAGQPAEFGNLRVDTRHGPVVEAGGGLVTIAAVIDRAQLLGGDPGGGDLAVLVAGLDAG